MQIDEDNWFNSNASAWHSFHMIVLSCIWPIELPYVRQPSKEVIPVARHQCQIESLSTESLESATMASLQCSAAIRFMRQYEIQIGDGVVWGMRGLKVGTNFN